MDTQDLLADKRDGWRRYFTKILVGTDTEIDAATDAAVAALLAGGSQTEAVAAGRPAAQRYHGGPESQPHATQGRPRSSPTSTPTSPTSTPTSATSQRIAGNAQTTPNVPRGSGTVVGMQQRQELFRGNYQVWSFRIRTPSDAGLPGIAVEMRARSIRGQIINGDVVEIPARRTNPKRVKNLTTGTVVKAAYKPHWFVINVAFKVLIVVGILLAIAAVAAVITTHF